MPYCPSVRPSHSWSSPKRLDISKWPCTIRGTDVSSFLEAKFPHLKFRVLPQRVRQKEARAKVGPLIRHISETVQDSQIESGIRAFHWYQNWWAWRIMNAVITAAIVRYFTEFVSWGAITITSKWLKINPYCQRQQLSQKNPVFSNIWLLAIIAEDTEN